MQQRIRWYSILPFEARDMARISAACLRDEFVDGRNWGLQIESSSKKNVVGRFIEQHQVTDKVVDPFGKTLEFSRVEFSSLSFRLSADSINLELYDAPVSLIGAFLNQLAAYLDFEVSISAPQIDVLKCLKKIGTKTENMTVKSLFLTDLTLSSSTQAQVIITGTEDVRSQVGKIAGNRKYQIHKATFEAKILERGLKCEICSDARANVIRGNDDSVLNLLREAVADSVIGSK